jgi:hypothetical protein
LGLYPLQVGQLGGEGVLGTPLLWTGTRSQAAAPGRWRRAGWHRAGALRPPHPSPQAHRSAAPAGAPRTAPRAPPDAEPPGAWRLLPEPRASNAHSQSRSEQLQLQHPGESTSRSFPPGTPGRVRDGAPGLEEPLPERHLPVSHCVWMSGSRAEVPLIQSPQVREPTQEDRASWKSVQLVLEEPGRPFARSRSIRVRWMDSTTSCIPRGAGPARAPSSLHRRSASARRSKSALSGFARTTAPSRHGRAPPPARATSALARTAGALRGSSARSPATSR